MLMKEVILCQNKSELQFCAQVNHLTGGVVQRTTKEQFFTCFPVVCDIHDVGTGRKALFIC
jgi:hypothetical protein